MAQVESKTAIIGAVGVVLAAIIAGLFAMYSGKPSVQAINHSQAAGHDIIGAAAPPPSANHPTDASR